MKNGVLLLNGIACFCVSELSYSSSTEMFNDEFSGLATQVFTPALMTQSIIDTPGAVTVITAAQIKNLGIQTIPDIFRIVPGFRVDYGGPFYGVNRGSNVPTPRRLQVLIDGVSEVNPLVGVVTYESFPVALERIARIEIVRSQSSASYGANAFYGTINIITKRPDDNLGFHTSASASRNGSNAYIGDAFSVGNTSVELDVKKSQRDQLEKMIRPEGSTYHDDMNVDMGSLNSVTHFDDGQELTLAVKGTHGNFDNDDGKTQFGQTYPIAQLDTLVESASFKFTEDRHILTISGASYYKDWNYHWPVCAPKAFFYPALGELYRENGPLVLAAVSLQPLPPATPDQLSKLNSAMTTILSDPTSFSTVCGDTNVDYRYKTNTASVNDIWQVSDALRISSSAQIESRRWESEAYNNGTTELAKSKIFSNAEYLIGKAWTLNGGVMAESLGYHLGDPEYSPRIGISYHINDWNTVKVVASEGRRLIDGIEILDHNQIPTHFTQPIYGSLVQSGFIGYFPLYDDKNHVEDIRSYEVIYYSSPKPTTVEVRYFVEDLSNVLNYQDGDASNIADFRRKGAEFDLGFDWQDINLNFTGYYLQSRSNSQFDDYDTYGGSAYVVKHYGNGWNTSLAYYGFSSIQYSSYDRTDLHGFKTLQFGRNSAEFGITLRHNRDHYLRSITNGTYSGGTYSPINEIIFDASMSF